MKVKSILIIFMLLAMTFNFSTCYASDISEVFEGGDKFVNSAEQSDIKMDEDKVKGTSDTIYRILLALGISIAVIVSGILGIKFMLGSTEEKAQVKETLIPFFIGCIIVFGAFSIWRIVVEIGNRL